MATQPQKLNAFVNLFYHWVSVFAAQLPHMAAVTLVMVDQNYFDNEHTAYRDFAMAEPDTQRVYFVKRVLQLPKHNQIGLILHELGHLADPRIHEPKAEKRADWIAHKLTGVAVRYDKRDVQTVGPGKKRPAYLHQ